MTFITIDRAIVEQALEALMGDPDAMVQIGAHEWEYVSDRAIAALRAALALAREQAGPVEDAELSAALGWPGGISRPVLDRKMLLQMVVALRPDVEVGPSSWLYTNVQSGDVEASTDPDWHQGNRELWHQQPQYIVPPRAALEDARQAGMREERALWAAREAARRAELDWWRDAYFAMVKRVADGAALQRQPVLLHRGCGVCGLGADGGTTWGYVCPRSDCPTRVTSGGAT